MPDDVKPVEQQVPSTEVPKSKEEWDKLSKEDPTRWMSLTQQRMDTIFRENREFKEKLNAAEQEKKNYQLELEKFKKPAEIVPEPSDEPYSQGQYPQTEDEWNDLFLERPAFAADLRNQYFLNQKNFQSEFVQARNNAVKTLTSEHADMYHAVLDENGKPKVDDKGKVIIQVDPKTGTPAFNESSEKGKLWVQIYEDAWVQNADGTKYNPYQHMKDAPLVMMAEMERRLRAKGAQMVNAQDKIAETDHSGVAPRGVPPPQAGPSKFRSEEERQLARKAIDRGVYKNEEEFLLERDRSDYGYVEENRRPDFSKR